MIARGLTAIGLVMIFCAQIGAAPAIAPPMRYPDTSRGYTLKNRGSNTASKLSGDLRILQRQFTSTRGSKSGSSGYSDSQLLSRYGISGKTSNPLVEITATTIPGTNNQILEDAGLAVHVRSGDIAYGSIRVRSLDQLIRLGEVKQVASVKSARVVPPFVSKGKTLKVDSVLSRGSKQKASDEFDKQGLSGKGVVVGIVDTGIDWKHPDFRRSDNTTRILYLYDMSDDSWTLSKGKVGSKPPFSVPSEKTGAKMPLGTLYTSAQINAALSGAGKIGSTDTNGHGTACAGVAAGKGLPSGAYAGVAPDADLIIVKHDEECDAGTACTAAAWIAEQAKSLGRPCAISLSFGSPDTSHDGKDASEELLDSITGKGKPGVAVCVSAGNDGRWAGHATGRFGPKVKGQEDITSESVELFVTTETFIMGCFDSKDQWGLAVQGLDNFCVTDSGEPSAMMFYKEGKELAVTADDDLSVPDDYKSYFDDSVTVEPSGDVERISLRLPPGRYLLSGFSMSEEVKSGRFDLYLPFQGQGCFGTGVDITGLIGTPGNAANVITVGSYDSLAEWENAAGQLTRYNLVSGELSGFSSPGYRRDGVVKPDVSAPGRYMISSLARKSEMIEECGESHVAKGGAHLAWSGTSASCPYVAGVIALMFEKNPLLDAAQIKDALTRTAIRDKFTGDVPNPYCGYGKVNPAAAISAVPAK